jgi:CHAT domain-containing protein/tetratricopeptide (TPR) repeat protein
LIGDGQTPTITASPETKATSQPSPTPAQVPPDINAIIGEINKELRGAQSLLMEGQRLMAKSNADSLPAREKLKQALTMSHSVTVKAGDKNLSDKISRSGDTAQQSLNALKVLEFYSKSTEALALNGIAQTHVNLGERQESIDSLKRALVVYQEIISDKTFPNISGINVKEHLAALKFTHAAGLANIGQDLDNHFGRSEEALKYLLQSLEALDVLYQETPKPEIKSYEALLFKVVGTIYGRESKSGNQAIEYFIKALETYRTLPNEEENIADSLNTIANQQSQSFDYKNAVENWERALAVYRKIDYKNGQSSVLRQMGLMYWALNNKAKVVEYANLNLAILQAPDFRENWQKRVNSQEIGIYNEFYNAFIEHTRLESIGFTYRLLDDFQKSLEYYEKALVVAYAMKQPRTVRLDLTAIAHKFAKLKQWEKAVEIYKQALEVSRKHGVREDIASDLQDVGWALLEGGKSREALQYQNEALSMYQSVGVDESKAFSVSFSNLLNELSRSHYALENKRLAIFFGKRAVSAIQGERQRLQNLDPVSQKGFLENKEKHYRRLADWLIEEGRFAQAELVLGMLKEEEYFDFVRRDSDEIRNLNQRVPLTDKEQKLIVRYSLLADRITTIGQEFSKLDEKKRKLPESASLPIDEQKRYDELSAQLTDANSAFGLFLEKELVAELGKEVIKTIEYDRNLQAKLRKWGAGTVAVRTVVTEDRYRVILTTPTVQVDGKSEIKAADLNRKVFAFREALQDRRRDPRILGKEIYDILIKPIEKDLQAAGAKTLIWSLDGTLRYIPLAALSPNGKTYLIEKYQNVIITPKTSDDISDSNATWHALGLGVSDSQSVTNPDKPEERLSFSALPGTKEELLAIVRDEKTPGEEGVLIGRRYLDKDFTMRNLTDSLTKETTDGKRQYTVVHVASHFRLGSNWSNSFLLLGNGQVLTLEQLNNSPEISFGDVELITLSACNTAFADDSNGKEVDSLAEAIQTKSGKAVLATLWSVADESTSILMSEFYRLRKENPQFTKATVLQMAQQEMIAGKLKPAQVRGERRDTSEANAATVGDYSHPYYWSPFVLIGNWR